MDKPKLKSKTLWFSGAVIIAVEVLRFLPDFHGEICKLETGGRIMQVIMAIVMLLRLATRTGLFILPLLLISGCVSPDFPIQDDPNPSPLDTGYHTMLIGSSCGPAYSFGQNGCSFESLDEAWRHSITLRAPLGGSIKVFSRECSYDEPPRIVAKGGEVTISLKEIMPIGAKFCRFNIWTYWEKPPQMTSAVPVRGQSAMFYVRVRGPGEKPSHLSWSPESGAVEGSGMLYAQFREIAREDSNEREPILLKVQTSESVERGKYQLYSEPMNLGIKAEPFSGQVFFVPRDTILGPRPKQGSYIMQGFAVSDTLRDDFILAVDIFGAKTAKLGAEVYFEDGELCYRTENTVSLVVLSTEKKVKSKPQDCFRAPTVPAIIAFYTNVGRAAYARIEGGAVKWIR